MSASCSKNTEKIDALLMAAEAIERSKIGKVDLKDRNLSGHQHRKKRKFKLKQSSRKCLKELGNDKKLKLIIHSPIEQISHKRYYRTKLNNEVYFKDDEDTSTASEDEGIIYRYHTYVTDICEDDMTDDAPESEQAINNIDICNGTFRKLKCGKI